MKSDIKNVATQIETEAIDHKGNYHLGGGTGPIAVSASGEITLAFKNGTTNIGDPFTIKLSKGSNIYASGTQGGFSVGGTHDNGAKHRSANSGHYMPAGGSAILVYNSNAGGFQSVSWFYK